jgi:hypothetical protein
MPPPEGRAGVGAVGFAGEWGRSGTVWETIGAMRRVRQSSHSEPYSMRFLQTSQWVARVCER